MTCARWRAAGGLFFGKFLKCIFAKTKKFLGMDMNNIDMGRLTRDIDLLLADKEYAVRFPVLAKPRDGRKGTYLLTGGSKIEAVAAARLLGLNPADYARDDITRPVTADEVKKYLTINLGKVVPYATGAGVVGVSVGWNEGSLRPYELRPENGEAFYIADDDVWVGKNYRRLLLHDPLAIMRWHILNGTVREGSGTANAGLTAEEAIEGMKNARNMMRGALDELVTPPEKEKADKVREYVKTLKQGDEIPYKTPNDVVKVRVYSVETGSYQVDALWLIHGNGRPERHDLRADDRAAAYWHALMLDDPETTEKWKGATFEEKYGSTPKDVMEALRLKVKEDVDSANAEGELVDHAPRQIPSVPEEDRANLGEGRWTDAECIHFAQFKKAVEGFKKDLLAAITPAPPMENGGVSVRKSHKERQAGVVRYVDGLHYGQVIPYLHEGKVWEAVVQGREYTDTGLRGLTLRVQEGGGHTRDVRLAFWEELADQAHYTALLLDDPERMEKWQKEWKEKEDAERLKRNKWEEQQQRRNALIRYLKRNIGKLVHLTGLDKPILLQEKDCSEGKLNIYTLFSIPADHPLVNDYFGAFEAGEPVTQAVVDDLIKYGVLPEGAKAAAPQGDNAWEAPRMGETDPANLTRARR